MTADDVRTLYAYNQWANRRILDASRPLDSAALVRNLGNSFGSLRNTLVHILWGEWIWLERWQHRSPKQLFSPEDFPDINAIEHRWKDVQRGLQSFVRQLADEMLQERIAYENLKGERWEYSLGQMLQHVVNHSTYHRGQVITLLRQLGATPLSTDYLLYFDETQQA